MSDQIAVPENNEKYLKAFFKQMNEWGVAMPAVKPLVSDFNLNEFLKTGLIEMWIVNNLESGYCGKYLFVFDGQCCPSHHHLKKHETFFIVKGKVKMTYDGKTFTMKPGDTLTVERGHNHAFVGDGPAVILEVSTPCVDDDDIFEDQRIPVGGEFLAVDYKKKS